MTGIADMIPHDTAFSMEVDSDAAWGGDAEVWSARLDRAVLDGDEVARGPVVAYAQVYRVHFDSDEWYEDIDSESSSAEIVAAAFLKRHEFEDDDDEIFFPSGLVVIDHIEVPEKWRGSKLSHALIRAITSVFRTDHIGLLPSEMSRGADGEHRVDRAKEIALRKHWQGVGFKTIPGSEVMWLPFDARTL